jgi:hypothetical protein
MSTSQVEGVYSVCLNTNRGIVVCSFDYADRFPEALADLGKWIAEGRIVRKYHIVQGLERAPEALSLLFTGDNTGKLSVPLALFFQLQPYSDPFLAALNHPELSMCPILRPRLANLDNPGL